MNAPALTAGLRVAFFTLGCKLNQFESDALASEFREAGCTVVEAEDGADVFIVNSCTVTNRADRKSRNLANRVERQLGQARLVVLTGCFAANQPDHADPRVIRVDNRHKHQIFRLVQERLGSQPSSLVMDETTSDPFGFRTSQLGFHTRATVKIQDGCDSCCSYCIIPTVRGPAISRSPAAILSEIRQLTAAGYREIVLTGVNMSRWTAPGSKFSGLIRSILDLELPVGHDFRLRLSSLEPEGLGPDFADLFRHPRLCPSLHLCLQSGSPRVLRDMKRSYTIEEFRALVMALRRIDPDFGLSTDLITGFPGETETEFSQSLALIDELGFHHVHVFPYSRRQGTAADGFPGQLPDRIKDGRAQLVRAGDAARRDRWLQRYRDRPLQLLVEGITAQTDDHISLSGMVEYGLSVSISLSQMELAAQLPQLSPNTIKRPLPDRLQASPSAVNDAVQLWNQFIALAANRLS